MSLINMKPALSAQSPIREQFRDPMDAGAPCRGVRDFSGIEARLEGQPVRDRRVEDSLSRENKFIQRLLDDRDRQYAALQEEVFALKRDWAWRTLCIFRRGTIRLRRQFWRAAAENPSIRRAFHPSAGSSAS
jgi:hypothetical protein